MLIDGLLGKIACKSCLSLGCVGKDWATNSGFCVGNSQNEVSVKSFYPRPTVDSKGSMWVPSFKGPALDFGLFHVFVARRHFPREG